METQRYGLIGYPAKGSLSPRLFEAAYHWRWAYDFIDEQDFGVALSRFLNGPYKAVNITAPHKLAAAEVAARKSEDVLATGAANILVKATEMGSSSFDLQGGGFVAEGSPLFAYNSDVLAVEELCRPLVSKTSDCVVVGGGGAGVAAMRALEKLGLGARLLHHEDLSEHPLNADLVIYTLPKAVPGIENIRCHFLIEANYRTPACKDLSGVEHYIGGLSWLKAQAVLGYELMTEVEPDRKAVMNLVL